jgi:hypothetical protein
VKANIHPLRVVIKALFLFVLINIVYALVDPPVYELSIYNSLLPGRERLPFGSSNNPYAVMVDDVDITFASHTISSPKEPAEIRVVLIGDSSVWGEGIPVQESIAVQWNNLDVKCGEQSIKVYNLAYPHPSVIKDLIILDKAVETNPDLIIWFVTLNTLIPRRLSPFLVANSERVADVLNRYDIPFANDDVLVENAPDFLDKTLIGQRSYLARWIKLQFLGVVWAATGRDSLAHASINRNTIPSDVSNDAFYRGMTEQTNDLKNIVRLEAVEAGHDIADPVPVLVVNEPIFIANGLNSDVRYNDIYPRWAYDEYRDVISDEVQRADWHYLDLWKSVPSQYFSDRWFHLTAEGERLLIDQITPTLEEIACR